MPYVIWCDLFSIKNENIDRQHQQLLEITNRFHQLMKNGPNSDSIYNTLNELIEYAQVHFADEEDFMRQIGYPADGIQQQHQAHEKMISDIFQLNEDLASGKRQTLFDLEVFLNEWLIKHILDMDKKMEPWITHPDKSSVKISD